MCCLDSVQVVVHVDLLSISITRTRGSKVQVRRPRTYPQALVQHTTMLLVGLLYTHTHACLWVYKRKERQIESGCCKQE